jgi:hypothetical protein
MKDRKCIFQEIQLVGDRIMLNPIKSLKFEELYYQIVAGNTLRAFHRIDKNATGPTEIVQDFIFSSKDKIINTLKNAQTTDDIDFLSNELFKELKSQLAKNVRKDILNNYNAVRKLVDLILEHVALIAKELNDYRHQIIGFLRVPLDSYILNSDCLFTYNERKKFELGTIGGGFTRIKTKNQYDSVQAHLVKIAESYKITYPIYFDVLWRNRLNYHLNILE